MKINKKKVEPETYLVEVGSMDTRISNERNNCDKR